MTSTPLGITICFLFVRLVKKMYYNTKGLKVNINMKKDKLDGQLCLFDYTEPGLPQISELENGEYYAFHYDWIFELYDGTKYHMPYGVDRNKKESNLLRYEEFRNPIRFRTCNRVVWYY